MVSDGLVFANDDTVLLGPNGYKIERALKYVVCFQVSVMGFRSLAFESATKTMLYYDKVRCKWCKTNLEELVLITPKTKLSSSFN